MKTLAHLWCYPAELFLKLEIFHSTIVEKIKTHILSSVTFFRKMCRL
jgi:hypothetical protein